MPESIDHLKYTDLIAAKKLHSGLLALVFPMLLAHLTAPLMGLVDTAVLGHMPGTHYLAGASFAALILSQIYWICGFIRMSTTGLSAQAKGQKSLEASSRVLYQSLFSAVFIGSLLFVSSPVILTMSLSITNASPEVQAVITAYFNVRIWGALAAMANLALIGWMLGQQHAKAVMAIQITGNLLNIGLNLLFVYGFGWAVEGVAAATVIVEYLIMICSLLYIFRRSLLSLNMRWLGIASLSVMTKINSAILVRNLALQACLIFMTFQGLRLGEQTAAVNAILMQFFVLISLGLDAVAFGVEAKVGEAKGEKHPKLLKANVMVGLFWSTTFAAAYALLFLFFSESIIRLLTNQMTIQAASYPFIPILIMLPIVGHWCFLMDGIFIGLTRAKAMQYCMLISAFVVYFPIWWLLESYGNWALWFALLGMLACRGISLGGYFVYLLKLRRLVD